MRVPCRGPTRMRNSCAASVQEAAQRRPRSRCNADLQRNCPNSRGGTGTEGNVHHSSVTAGTDEQALFPKGVDRDDVAGARRLVSHG